MNTGKKIVPANDCLSRIGEQIFRLWEKSAFVALSMLSGANKPQWKIKIPYIGQIVDLVDLKYMYNVCSSYDVANIRARIVSNDMGPSSSKRVAHFPAARVEVMSNATSPCSPPSTFLISP